MSEGTAPAAMDGLGPMEEHPDLHGCTALVLGAGASRPYGFPTGKQLVEDICQYFPDFFEGLNEYSSTPSERRAKAEDLVRRLQDSACVSIDEFLADHAMDAELVHVGKIAIARSLLPREDDGKFRGTKDWYELLIHSWCNEPVKLGVITFNYDRSFEHRFWSALVARFCESDAKDHMVIPETQTIVVKHVHGQFGELPWQACDGRGVPYGIAPNEDLGRKVMQAANQLRLMFEPPSRAASAAAGHILVRASRVFFLGFGYDQRNLARIIPTWEQETLQRDATIAGTAYGLTCKEAQRAELVLRQWAGDGWHGEVEIVDKKCLEAIRERDWLG